MDIERRAPLRVILHSLVAGTVLLAGLAGCGEEGVTPATIRRTIALKDVPEVVLKAAQKKLPEVRFEEAFENREKGITLQSYEIKGRAKNGKIREVRVSLTGEILEVE